MTREYILKNEAPFIAKDLPREKIKRSRLQNEFLKLGSKVNRKKL